MSFGIELKQEDLEFIQNEWDIQENSQTRVKQRILDILNHDIPKHEKKSPKKTTEPITDLEEGKWLKELPGKIVDDPIQRDVDTRNGPATVAHFRMKGDYGTAKVTLWNNQADLIMNYTAGASIILTNVQVKPPYEGLQQIGGSRNTKIRKG